MNTNYIDELNKSLEDTIDSEEFDKLFSLGSMDKQRETL